MNNTDKNIIAIFGTLYIIILLFLYIFPVFFATETSLSFLELLIISLAISFGIWVIIMCIYIIKL